MKTEKTTPAFQAVPLRIGSRPGQVTFEQGPDRAKLTPLDAAPIVLALRLFVGGNGGFRFRTLNGADFARVSAWSGVISIRIGANELFTIAQETAADVATRLDVAIIAATAEETP